MPAPTSGLDSTPQVQERPGAPGNRFTENTVSAEQGPDPRHLKQQQSGGTPPALGGSALALPSPPSPGQPQWARPAPSAWGLGATDWALRAWQDQSCHISCQETGWRGQRLVQSHRQTGRVQFEANGCCHARAWEAENRLSGKAAREGAGAHGGGWGQPQGGACPGGGGTGGGQKAGGAEEGLWGRKVEAGGSVIS